MKKWTLEQLIEIGRQPPRGGDFGVDEIKQSIIDFLEMCERNGKKRSLYELLEKYVKDANAGDLLFNAKQVYACWELINETD